MKDKEKQIEEMAKDLIRMAGLPYIFDKAVYLIDLGYQKIDKDRVVLSREEYEEIKQYKDYIPELKKAFDKIRKDTAEKILCELKNKGSIITEFDWNDYLKIDIDELKIIAKQYGVEIKE